MGKSDRHRKDWEPTKLQAIIDARSLANYTTHIISNANRLKLRRLVSQCLKGEVTKDDCDNSLECIIAHLLKGDNFKVINRLINYYNNIWKEFNYGN